MDADQSQTLARSRYAIAVRARRARFELASRGFPSASARSGDRRRMLSLERESEVERAAASTGWATPARVPGAGLEPAPCRSPWSASASASACAPRAPPAPRRGDLLSCRSPGRVPRAAAGAAARRSPEQVPEDRLTDALVG